MLRRSWSWPFCQGTRQWHPFLRDLLIDTHFLSQYLERRTNMSPEKSLGRNKLYLYTNFAWVSARARARACTSTRRRIKMQYFFPNESLCANFAWRFLQIREKFAQNAQCERVKCVAPRACRAVICLGRVLISRESRLSSVSVISIYKYNAKIDILGHFNVGKSRIRIYSINLAENTRIILFAVITVQIFTRYQPGLWRADTILSEREGGSNRTPVYEMLFQTRPMWSSFPN